MRLPKLLFDFARNSPIIARTRRITRCRPAFVGLLLYIRAPLVGDLAVNHQPSAGLVLKKIALFTLLGVITILFVGPVVAILSVLFSLAATLAPVRPWSVSFVWAAFLLVLHGREETEVRLRNFRQGAVPGLAEAGRTARAVVRFPFEPWDAWLAPWFTHSDGGSEAVGVRPLVGSDCRNGSHRRCGRRRIGAVSAPTHDPNSAITNNAVLGGLMAAARASLCRLPNAGRPFGRVACSPDAPARHAIAVLAGASGSDNNSRFTLATETTPPAHRTPADGRRMPSRSRRTLRRAACRRVVRTLGPAYTRYRHRSYGSGESR